MYAIKYVIYHTVIMNEYFKRSADTRFRQWRRAGSVNVELDIYCCT